MNENDLFHQFELVKNDALSRHQEQEEATDQAQGALDELAALADMSMAYYDAMRRRKIPRVVAWVLVALHGQAYWTAKMGQVFR